MSAFLLYCPPFYFIVRLSTLLSAFLLYCPPFYFIVLKRMPDARNKLLHNAKTIGVESLQITGMASY
jgi:hypothetical protein